MPDINIRFTLNPALAGLSPMGPAADELAPKPSSPEPEAPRDQHQLHDSHPDKVSIEVLREQVADKLTYLESKLKIKFPQWFRSFTNKACLTMQTTNRTRLLALGNDTAEAFTDLIKAHIPWLEKPFYFCGWGASLAYVAIRNIMVAIRGGGMAVLKTVSHDLVAEVFVPPFIVRNANRLQDALARKILGAKPNSFFASVIHVVRPFTSMTLGAGVMKHLDKYMVENLPKWFNKLPANLTSAVDKLGADIGGSLATKFCAIAARLGMV